MNTTKSCARNGKIARLPESIRAELNQRLRDGQSSNLILPWLNGLPETKDLPKPINKVNLTAWRQGGFAEDSLRILQTERLKEMTTFAFQLAHASQNPSPVGRRCSAALTSRDHPLAQGAMILATAQLFELLNNNPDLDQLTQIIKSLVTLRRTEISQQNANIREQAQKLAHDQFKHRLPKTKRRKLDDNINPHADPNPNEPLVPEEHFDLIKFNIPPATETAPATQTTTPITQDPAAATQTATPATPESKPQLSPVKVDEAKPAPKKYIPLYDINDFLPKLPGDGLIA